MKKLTTGFTFVEIMIVVAIIGLLLALAIPSLIQARHSAQETMITNNMRVIRDTFELLAFEQMTDPIYIDPDDVFKTIGQAPPGEPLYNCMYWPQGNIFFLDININEFPALSLYWTGNDKWYSTENIFGGTFQEMFIQTR